MNTRDLEYLVALSDYRHFGKAAQACFVSQPALSMQIQRLEAVLGVKLLERGNKSVLLTDIGLAITERARHILTQVNEIHDLARLAKDPYSGELRIGVIPTLAPYLLPLIIPSLSQQFAKIHFYLWHFWHYPSKSRNLSQSSYLKRSFCWRCLRNIL